jgi:3-oxosteroid 1-dehydrogenase
VHKTKEVNPDARLRISRRGFLKASGVGVAVAGAVGGIGFAHSRAFTQQKWDAEYDVVVVGSGAAGFAAAIAARHLGAKVAILEKGTYVGGTTLVSGGVSWIPNNSVMRARGLEDPRKDAIKYMAKYSWPHLYNPDDEKLGLTDHDFAMISAYYDCGSNAMDLLQKTGAVTWSLWVDRKGQPFKDYMDHMPENKAVQGRAIVAANDDGTGARGAVLVTKYIAHAERVGIPILLNHRVERVILNSAGEVVGVEATVLDAEANGAKPGAVRAGRSVAIRARKGVIFGSGGFARNEDLMHNLMPFPYVGGCSAPTNEGEFLRIASSVNAKLSHLDNVWRNQALFEQALTDPRSYNCIFTWGDGDSLLLVNRSGRRFVNEKRPYQLRGQAHLEWDANEADFRNRLTFAVYDGRVQENWAGSFPIPNDPETTPHMIIGATLKELATAITERLEKLAPHTGGFALANDFTANFLDEVQKFNKYARNGQDLDFRRGSFGYDLQHNASPPRAKRPTIEYPSADQRNPTMYPLREDGPYYAMIITSGWFDTNGGPVIDTNAQVITWNNEPVPGLYGAGNCVASASNNAYWGGGTTIGNAHVWGVAAARHAVASIEKVISSASAS